MYIKKQERYDRVYLDMAEKWASLSHCSRKKVGSLIVKNGMIISDGYNGTPTGHDNSCELESDGLTKWFVLHSEANAILKCARYGQSCNGATLYLTHSPCRECSKLILQSGIIRIIYQEDYRDMSGVDFLIDAGLKVKQIKKESI